MEHTLGDTALVLRLPVCENRWFKGLLFSSAVVTCWECLEWYIICFNRFRIVQGSLWTGPLCSLLPRRWTLRKRKRGRHPSSLADDHRQDLRAVEVCHAGRNADERGSAHGQSGELRREAESTSDRLGFWYGRRFLIVSSQYICVTSFLIFYARCGCRWSVQRGKFSACARLFRWRIFFINWPSDSVKFYFALLRFQKFVRVNVSKVGLNQIRSKKSSLCKFQFTVIYAVRPSRLRLTLEVCLSSTTTGACHSLSRFLPDWLW